MVNVTVELVKQKVLALKPNTKDGVLNNLSPELFVLENLGRRLARRKMHIASLENTLNRTNSSVDTSLIRKMIKPLRQTVEDISAWLNNAKSQLAKINTVVKVQNEELSRSLGEFLSQNPQKAAVAA